MYFGGFLRYRKKKIQSSVCWVHGSGDYDRKKKKIQSSVWRVVLLYCVSFWFWREIGSFFVVAGNFHYDRKKKIHYDRKKKRYSRLSDGCGVLGITTGKKKIQSSVWRVVLWWFWRLRPEKKVQSKKRYITTGKKRYSCLSDGCTVLGITTGKKKDTVVCLAGCAVVLCQFLVLAGNW